jgi:toxin FitB
VNIVDSSGWIEFFVGGAGADFFAEPIRHSADLLVPAICFYEVYRHILRQRGDEPAEMAAAQMRTGQVVDLTVDIAVSAATIGHDLKLAMADSVILATARAFGATLWTQDADFREIDGVKYRQKT